MAGCGSESSDTTGGGGDQADADAALPPDAAPPPPDFCMAACDRVTTCFTQPEPQLCTCAADLDTGTLHEACLGQCNQFFAQRVESANTCERVVAAMNEFYPLLGVYCGADGHCPAPPPPHFGGEPPAELPPVCVAFTDRMTQCITEACPALEVYQDPFARDLWYSCSSALTGQIPFPYVDAVEAEAFERRALQGCDAPGLEFLVDRRIQADRQLHSPQLLAHFCAEGPLVPEEECRAACDLWTQCNLDWDMLACMYWCSAEAANTATIMCATTAVDCDTLTGCFAPISKADPGVLANYPGGECYQSEILPAPGEEGMLVATRLTPPSYPWRVETVQYTAAAFQAIDYTCSTAFDARVEVSVIDGETPPAAPELLAVIPVEGLELPPDTMRFVDLPLPEPIVLREGQHLLVAISEGGTFPEIACVVGCRARVAEPNRFFWSNATESPYTWATLDSFDITNEYMIFATGAPGE
jgi:hypothetical protein